MRRVLDRHLPLRHRLEQRGLRLRRSAVDLVAEEQVREDRPRPELEVAGALVVDRRAGDVGGHQVGRELDPLEAHVAHLRERARDQRLREARVVLEQHVAVGEKREQAGLERAALADHRLLDLVEDPLGVLADLLDRELAHRPILSISSTSAETSSSGRPRSAPVGGRLAVGANDGPQARGHQLFGLIERDAVTPPDRGVRRLDERAPEAVVEVRRVLDRERDVALEPLQLLRTAVARRAGVRSAAANCDFVRRVAKPVAAVSVASASPPTTSA